MPKGSVAHTRLRFLVFMAGAKAHGYGNHTFPIVTQSLRKMRLLNPESAFIEGFEGWAGGGG